MKKWIPWIVLAVFGAWLVMGLRPARETEWAVREFGRLPLLSGGRLQPIDSVARIALMQLRDKQTANLEPWKGNLDKPKLITATEWFMGMSMNPQLADTWPVIRIDNPDLKGLLKLPMDGDEAKQTDGKHFAWNQIKDHLESLQNEARRVAKIEAQNRKPFDQAVDRLWTCVGVYMRMQNTIQPQNATNWPVELAAFLKNIEPGVAAMRAREAGREFDGRAYTNLLRDAGRFDAMASIEPPVLLVPPSDPGTAPLAWEHMGHALLDAARGDPLPPAVQSYAAMAGAYRSGQAAEFNRLVTEYRSGLVSTLPQALAKVNREVRFNHYEPFYKAMVLLVLAFLLGIVYWFAPERLDPMRLSALALVGLALVLFSAGLITRMILEGRPPVTNLYSSAVFIGWGVCVLGLLLEAFWRNGVGVVVSSIIGFLTLIVAHHLSIGTDTMKMLQAVLDTNFWLATHVVIITLGYAATFLSGFLAILFIVLGVFTPILTRTTAGARTTPEMSRALAKMVYAIICFATLFSFVGTVLGGIWADQSWGRFWGWDPKENGALIIVLWNALILHARWGGMVKERGLMNLAIVGNIVTSWSWFGTNMLGIGLHAYGFMDAAFRWLMIFIGANLLFIALGSLPLSYWRSFRKVPAVAAKSRELATVA